MHIQDMEHKHRDISASTNVKSYSILYAILAILVFRRFLIAVKCAVAGPLIATGV
jgi:hypothetical protein